MSDSHLLTQNPRLNDAIYVDRFTERMNAKLYANRFKAHWSTVDQAYLIKRLKEEVKELEEALKFGLDVSGECADVANFAMMISDNHESREK
jgi:NTP pyrophosphatase (non-canonical NTP hydrolase)